MTAEYKTRDDRLDELFQKCQLDIISQIIGPFGLSTAMFNDRNGGNVTTLKNFSESDSSYVAKKDQLSYQEANGRYIRDKLKDKKEFDIIQKELQDKKIDGYTGKQLNEKGDTDHIVSLKNIHETKKNHLAYNTGSEQGRKDLAKQANSKDNLVQTTATTNRSKGAKSNAEYLEYAKEKGRYVENPYLMTKVGDEAESKLNKEANKKLLKKQSNELMAEGGKQALLMAMKSIFGEILIKVTNELFNEVKEIIEIGSISFESCKIRLKTIFRNVLKDLKGRIQEIGVKGLNASISGFISNLITFIINNFIKTAKKFVKIIRDGFSSLTKAFKLLLFPPENITREEALQAALKIISTVIIASVGFLFEESLNSMIMYIPILGQFSSLITPVIFGIITGLISAFAAYKIDLFFDKKNLTEKEFDVLITQSENISKLADVMAENIAVLNNIFNNYNEIINANESISDTLFYIDNEYDYLIACKEERIDENERLIHGTKEILKKDQEIFHLIADI